MTEEQPKPDAAAPAEGGAPAEGQVSCYMSYLALLIKITNTESAIQIHEKHVSNLILLLLLFLPHHLAENNSYILANYPCSRFDISPNCPRIN